MRGSLPLIVMLWILSGVAPAAAQFPLFDAHIHYSRPEWAAYTPERVLSILAAAGVRRDRIEHPGQRHAEALREGAEGHRPLPPAVSYA